MSPPSAKKRTLAGCAPAVISTLIASKCPPSTANFNTGSPNGSVVLELAPLSSNATTDVESGFAFCISLNNNPSASYTQRPFSKLNPNAPHSQFPSALTISPVSQTPQTPSARTPLPDKHAPQTLAESNPPDSQRHAPLASGVEPDGHSPQPPPGRMLCPSGQPQVPSARIPAEHTPQLPFGKTTSPAGQAQVPLLLSSAPTAHTQPLSPYSVSADSTCALPHDATHDSPSTERNENTLQLPHEYPGLPSAGQLGPPCPHTALARCSKSASRQVAPR